MKQYRYLQQVKELEQQVTPFSTDLLALKVQDKIENILRVYKS